MIDTQLIDQVLLVLALLVGLATAFSAAMLIAPSAANRARPGRPPRGGLRRDLPRPPQPEPEQPLPEPQPQLQPEAEADRELVLV